MEKSINEFVSEMKNVFGMFEVKATNFETGQEGKSKGWIEQSPPALEISLKEYNALGDLKNKAHELEAKTLNKFLTIIKSKQKKNGTKAY